MKLRADKLKHFSAGLALSLLAGLLFYQDMIEVLTSFCARLYGRRSAKNKAKKALEAIQCEN